jgi:hypothetical protein
LERRKKENLCNLVFPRLENISSFRMRAKSRCSSLLAAFSGLLLCGCGDVPSTPGAVEIPALRRSAEASLERAAALRDRAKLFDQERTLESLSTNRKNGEYFRFDERIDEARPEGAVAPVPPARGHVAGLRFEFEGDDTHSLLPVRETAHIREGVLEVDHDQLGFLMSQGEFALPRTMWP